MSMITALPARQALAGGGLTYNFGGSGGYQPYAYSVYPGGAGGTIDPVSGTYTSPLVVPSDPRLKTDTILITDGEGNTATCQAVILTPLELFCDVIQTVLGLPDRRVYLWDQKINAPTDSGIFVAVAVISEKIFGNNRSLCIDDSGNQAQQIYCSTLLQCDLISRGSIARDTREDFVMALNSSYSEAQQELNSFKIYRCPSDFINLSEEDGSAIPYRFSINVRISYTRWKTTAVPYFDNFPPPVAQVVP